MEPENEQKHFECQPFLKRSSESHRDPSFETDGTTESPFLQKHHNRCTSKWLIYGLLFPYVALTTLCIILYINPPANCLYSSGRLDLFPCEKLVHLAFQLSHAQNVPLTQSHVSTVPKQRHPIRAPKI